MLNERYECTQYLTLPPEPTQYKAEQENASADPLDRTAFRLNYRELTNNLKGLERAMVMAARHFLFSEQSQTRPVPEVKELLSRWSGAAPVKKYIRIQDGAWTSVTEGQFYGSKTKRITQEEKQKVPRRIVRQTKLCRPHVLYYFAQQDLTDKTLTDEALLVLTDKRDTAQTVFPARVSCDMCSHRKLCESEAIRKGFLANYVDTMHRTLEQVMQTHLEQVPEAYRPKETSLSSEWFEQTKDNLLTKASVEITNILNKGGLKPSLQKDLLAYRVAIDAQSGSKNKTMGNTRHLRNHKDLLAPFFALEDAFRHVKSAKDAFEMKDKMLGVKNQIHTRASTDMRPLYLTALDTDEMSGNSYKKLCYEKAIAMAMEAGAPKQQYLVAENITKPPETDAKNLLKTLFVEVTQSKNGSEETYLDIVLKLTAAYLLSRKDSERSYTPVNLADVANWGLHHIRLENKKDMEKYQYQTGTETRTIFTKTNSLHADDKDGSTAFLCINADWLTACGWRLVDAEEIDTYKNKLYFRDDGSGKLFACCETYEEKTAPTT